MASSSSIHQETKDPSTSSRRNPTPTSSSTRNHRNNDVALGIPADDNWNTDPSAMAPRTTTATTATTDSASDRALVNEDQSMTTLSTNRTGATPTATTMEDGAAKVQSSSGRNPHIKSSFHNEDDDDNTNDVNPTDAAIRNEEDEYSMDTISTYPHSIGGTIPGSVAPSYESSTMTGLATVPEDTMSTMPTETVTDRNGNNNFQLNNNLQNRYQQQQQQQQPNYHRPSTLDNQSVSTVSTDPSMVYPGAVRVPGRDAEDHNDDDTLIIDSGPAYTGPSTTTAENTVMYYQPYSFDRNRTANVPPTTFQSNNQEVMSYSPHNDDTVNGRNDSELTNVQHFLKKYRILFLALIIGLLIVAGVGIGIGIGFTSRTSSSKDPIEEDHLQSAVPSASPPAQVTCAIYPKSPLIQSLPGQAVAEYEKLVETDLLSQVLPGLDIGSMEPCSPTHRALVWAANDAVLSGGFSAQRFLLAVIYFALDGDNWTFNYWWLLPQLRPCNEYEDCEALELYRQELNRQNARECLWSHITCDENHKVVHFTLTNAKASGSISSEIGLLSTLSEYVILDDVPFYMMPSILVSHKRSLTTFLPF